MSTLTTQCSVVTCCHNPERSSIQEAATAFDAATARASSSTHATVKDAHTTVELLSAGHARRRSNQLNVNGCTPLRMASPARLPQKHCDTSNVIRMLTCHMQALCQQRHHRSMQVQDQSCCASAVAAIQSWQYHAGAAIKTLATTHRGSGSCVCTCAGSWHSCGSHAPATVTLHCIALQRPHIDQHCSTYATACCCCCRCAISSCCCCSAASPCSKLLGSHSTYLGSSYFTPRSSYITVMSCRATIMPAVSSMRRDVAMSSDWQAALMASHMAAVARGTRQAAGSRQQVSHDACVSFIKCSAVQWLSPQCIHVGLLGFESLQWFASHKTALLAATACAADSHLSPP